LEAVINKINGFMEKLKPVNEVMSHFIIAQGS
jgi:hypothetical protein